MNGLINLEIKILALYHRLCLLELKGLKDSQKYHNILDDLKKKLNQEAEFLKRVDFSSVNFDKLIEKVESSTGNEEAIQIRIMALLTGPIINNMCKEADATTLEIDDKILEEAQTNMAMFTAKYLSDAIKEEQDENIKKIMIINFYDLCYIQPRLGALLLEDSFEMRDKYFKSCYFVADIFHVNRNDAEKAIDTYCSELCLEELNKLFSKTDNMDYETKKIGLKISSCDIKAIFAVLSDEGFSKTKEAFEEMCEEQQFTSHPDYEFVANLFEQFKKSQPKVATITFGKPL